MSKSKVLSTHLKIKTLSQFLGPDTAVAYNFVLPSSTETMTAIGYWFLHSTFRRSNMIAGHLFVAERKVNFAEEEGD